jgi:membrane protease YdiL (CAAX protease family)
MTARLVRNQNDSLLAFFVLTFAITWGLALLLVIFPATIKALFGAVSVSNPLFILAVAGPSIAASILTFSRGGWSGLLELYRRLIQWRFGVQWYALLLLGIPMVVFCISRVAGSKIIYDLSTPTLLVLHLLNELILGPLGEELGWRGFALPRLLERYSPFKAGLLLGIIWGAWHLPSFFVSGLPQTQLAIPMFMLGALCLSILATWVFVHTGRSVLATVLFHFAVNSSMNVFGVSNDAFVPVAMVAAVLVVLLDQRLAWFKPKSIHMTQARGSI